MTGKNPWNQRCHSTVSWKDVNRDAKLIERSESGSIEIHFCINLAIILSSVSLLHILIKQYKSEKETSEGSESRNRIPNRERPPSRFIDFVQSRGLLPPSNGGDSDELADVLGFLRECDCYVGPRETWIADVTSELDERGLTQLVEFLPDVLDRVYDEDVVLNRESMLSNEQVDFTNNLLSIGGPVPNLYTKNLVYGNDLSLPYKFLLNPEPEKRDLSECSVDELRRIGMHDDSEFDRPPNWSIADKTGEVAVIDGEETRPVPDEVLERWVRDYFMILKTPNVHPRATGTTTLTLAGCHGIGTYGAISEMRDIETIRKIAKEVGDGYFQVVGRVDGRAKRGGLTKIDDTEILSINRL